MEKTEKLILTVCFCAALAFSGTAKAQTPSSSAVDGKGDEAPESSSYDRFAFDLYKKNSAVENFFFSPISAYAAFAMAYEGAAGATRQEFQKVFLFSEDGEARREYFKKLAKELNFSGPEGEMVLANSFWAQKECPFLPAYLGVLKDSYSAQAENLDFVNKTEEARKKINSWAEEKTKKKIKSVLPPGSLTALTRLALVNAVYFKGFWENKFDKQRTYADFFMKSEKEKKPVLMMKYDGDKRSGYMANEYMEMLELPYKGERFSMLILLPAPGEMKRTEEALTPENFRRWEKELVKSKARIFLPRFKMEYFSKLDELLPAMGLKTAFAETADFSGMDGTKKLYIRKALQKAFIEVNEEGSEAAAVTAVMVAAKSIALPRVFKVNRPFIFLIKDKKNGTLLFMGKVSDPESK